jgi:hypothetical protein
MFVVESGDRHIHACSSLKRLQEMHCAYSALKPRYFLLEHRLVSHKSALNFPFSSFNSSFHTFRLPSLLISSNHHSILPALILSFILPILHSSYLPIIRHSFRAPSIHAIFLFHILHSFLHSFIVFSSFPSAFPSFCR